MNDTNDDDFNYGRAMTITTLITTIKLHYTYRSY